MKMYKKEMAKYIAISVVLAVLGIALTVVGLVLASSPSDASGIALFFLPPGVVLIIAGGMVLLSIRSVKRSYCSKCKTPLEYDRDVEWEEEEEIIGERNIKSVVRFVTHCSNCGHTHEFKEKITTAMLVQKNNGNEDVKLMDLENTIRKKFRHKK